MCFWNECDWHAQVVEHDDEVLDRDIKCFECRRTIKAGQLTHCVFMQEREECRECDEVDCTCGEKAFGETYHCRSCDECFKFLNAVSAAEIAAGCNVSESRPSYEGMIEEISNSGMDEAKKYFKRALVTFPELKTSGYLKWFWKEMFAHAYSTR